MGDWGEENQARRALAVVFLLKGVLDECIKFVLEFLEPRLAAKRLVVAEKCEDHIGPGVGRFKAILTNTLASEEPRRLGDRRRSGQPLVWGAKRLRAKTESQFVAGEAEVAHDKFALSETPL